MVITIGITGHRNLNANEGLSEAISSAVKTFVLSDNGVAIENCKIEIMSALAEGADRIAARILMDNYKAGLIAVLPFNKKQYETDFKSPASMAEFNELLESAQEIITLESGAISSQSEKNNAYLACGEHVVDSCDYLIAVWDGKKANGKGGTGDIVKYAMSTKKETIIINSKTYAVSIAGEYQDYSKEAETINIEESELNKVYSELFCKKTFDNNEQLDMLEHMPEAHKIIVSNYLLPKYIIADKLSLKYQNYFKLSMIIFLFAFMTTFSVTAGVSFGGKEMPSFVYLIEAVGLIMVMIIYNITRRGIQHSWVENRMLAEYMRIFIFSAVFHKNSLLNEIKNKKKFIKANRFLILMLKSTPATNLYKEDITEIKKYLGLWFDRQKVYHKNNLLKHDKFNKRWSRTTILCFTVLAVIILVHTFWHPAEIVASTLLFFTLIIPALASTIAAVKYVRNDMSYTLNSKIMCGVIDHYSRELKKCNTVNQVESLAEEAGLMFIHELERWYISAISHELELAL